MILFLTARKDTALDPELARLGEVRQIKVPRAPSKRASAKASGKNSSLDNNNWSYAPLTELNAIIDAQEVETIVCGDDKCLPFAQLLGEWHPDVPVLADQAISIRILSELRDRETPVTRRTVHDLLDQRRLSRAALPQFTFDPEARPQTVVSLVQNAVEGDSRVQKVAESLAAVGYQSILLGRAPETSPAGDWFLVGNALVIRLPVVPSAMQAQRQAPPSSLLARVFGYGSQTARTEAERRLNRELGRIEPDQKPRLSTRFRSRVTRWRSSIYRENRRSFTTMTERNRYHERKAARMGKKSSWTDPEAAFPVIGDLEEQFGPAIDALLPNAIHVHDPSLLGIAVRARNRLQRSGLDTRLVYDAHEWTPGLERPHAYHTAALMAVEQEFIGEVDARITVSDEIAMMMMREFGLDKAPVVVENAPKSGMDESYQDIRSDAGVPMNAPLLVYVGGISEIRGVQDAVTSLRYLPDAHLVLLSPADRSFVELQKLADTQGVGARLHQLDYVPADKVVSYLRTVDIGLAPHRPSKNHGLALPTKFREYMLADVPIVATDLGVVGDFIRETGLGETSEPQNPRSLAEAVQKVLADLPRYRSAITDELKTVHSWESQERKLAAVLEGLIGTPSNSVELAPRVLIGATNSAGQAYAWASALRDAGLDAQSLAETTVDQFFDYPSDHTLPRSALGTLDRRSSFFLNFVARSETIIIESATPIAAPDPARIASRRSGFRQARALQAAGRNVGMIFHGSDIRRPDRHARTHRWSPFNAPESAQLRDKYQAAAQVVHEELAAWEGPVMVSTPDLLSTVAGASWVPVVIDFDLFPVINRSDQDASRPPLVVHLPSSSVFKGSQLIDPVLRTLASEGVIRYARFQKIPHSEVPSIMAQADIVVDQMGMGILGVAGVEAMASGAALVTDPGPEALEAYGEQVPLCVADPENLAQQVTELAADRGRLQELAVAGRAFAERHHDGRASARVISKAMDLIPGTSPANSARPR